MIAGAACSGRSEANGADCGAVGDRWPAVPAHGWGARRVEQSSSQWRMIGLSSGICELYSLNGLLADRAVGQSLNNVLW